jgi:hypothetical protein
MMYDPANPYASPVAPITPAATEWLGAQSASLRRVATGLGLIYTGIVLVLVAIVVLIGMIVLRIRPPTAIWVSRGAGVLSLIGAMFNVIGVLFCLATPPETRARGLIFTSVGAMLVTMLFAFFNFLQQVRLVAPLPTALNVASPLLAVVSVVSFLWFLRRLNQFVGRPDLARRAIVVIVYVCFVIAMYFLSLLYFGNWIERLDIAMALLAFFGMIIIYAIWLVLYANLVTHTRSAILGKR